MSKRLRRSRRETTAAEDTDIAKYSAEEQLSLLETWLESAKASTYEAINSHHRDFLTIRLYGKDPLDEVATLNDKCETVRTSVSNNADYQQRLDAIGQGLDATMRLAKTHADLKEVDEQIMHGEVAVAASTIAEVCDLLKGLEGDCPQFVEHSAVATLQTQYIKKRSALRAELDYLMSKMYAVRSIGSVYELAVSYSVTANYDGVPYETPITISDVFFALTQLGLDKEKVAPLAKTLVDHWFVPLLRSPAETLSVSKVSMFATMNIGAFTPDRREDEVDQGADLQVQCELVRDKWETVLGFIREEIFHDINPMEDHTEIYVYLGANLWSSLCPLLEEYLLIPLIPTDLDSLTDTRAMVPLLRLEEAWLDYGLITPEALVVKESVRSSLQNYINKRRRDLLTTVASILATDDTNTVVVGGAGPVADVLSEMASGGKKSSEKNSKTKGKGFAMSAEGDGEDAGSLTFPRCSISVQAQMLVEFAQETIGLSLEDDAKTAVLYLHAVRDAFALYRCLIPRQWATELLVNPKRAFVMHNDCEFICHHLSTLGFRYRERWPAVVKSAATFVDTIGTYRALSKSSLQSLLSRHRDELMQALGPWSEHGTLDESRLGDSDVYDSMETKLTIACGLVGQISHIASAHLPRATYFKVLGLLADVVVGCVCQRIEEIPLASDLGARALVRLISPVLGLEDRLSYSAVAAGAHSRPTSRKAPIARYTPSWDRLLQHESRLSAIPDKRPG